MLNTVQTLLPYQSAMVAFLYQGSNMCMEGTLMSLTMVFYVLLSSLIWEWN